MPQSPKQLVERFYLDLWNKADEAVARQILHPEFRFRASLGPERRGPVASSSRSTRGFAG